MNPDDSPKSYAFLLLPGFSTLGFSCALDCLSLANHHPSGRQFYHWRMLSADGNPVSAYNGVRVEVDCALTELDRHETLIVCAGENAGQGSTKPVLNWLRRETRKGMDYGALSSGTYTLALAGLIGGKRVTTHWEYKTALAEMLPDVVMEDTLYSVDGRVFTSAGGAASMDLMLYRVSADYGTDLATWVADQMVYTAPRAQSQGQRMSLLSRPEVRNAKLLLTIQIMENNLEDPLRPDEIAELIHLSTRQLERLFARYLSTSPKRYYLHLRLEKARNLLRQTDLSVTDVCVACGFKSLSHFSKSYRNAYGNPPGTEAADGKVLWSGNTKG
ncbi:GlxA family transcriptional regulator [Sulfitobacter sp. M57]|uniref:GlxA family transcriptional regulator n=1 Tax=unclassified Sulfitobacter TaxID=196795 RepID=UPI0023E1E3FF|nr:MULTISPECIES: GlxA family transcriptional regulator [unclassified Sulfitobacter]MDF3414890.1 GlxA family transcriptional regulator [Sulfitobacter sp. KE5]MDF3422371.1 GlxA family transcriptional regulator [Sulfitobacter sp. KE43]MDF3433436.1 GlxA family transcriptional regulator [Sulfitobacter sp. KE42]MDF3459076.1 GlxA family transcriptional regulator [Sulfitobacter sp. S74]MDF3462975.1 GlxA family transcriptional regulator [Sulfitobacter sp. Ks18]